MARRSTPSTCGSAASACWCSSRHTLSADDIFGYYAYFSSYSESWVTHARKFVDAAAARLSLDASSFVVEVASNDGYLLQHVLEKGIRGLGVEPAANVAEVAIANGVPTEVAFLGEETGRQLADRHGRADLVVANNVFAHVPDIVDFAKGLRNLVAETGIVSIEIPHLLRLIEGNEYDTIYHEHFSYLSLLTTQRVLAEAGLTVVDVDELQTHGGSLRTWSMPSEVATDPSAAVASVLLAESAAGLDTLEGHAGFASSVARVRNDFVEFLIECSRTGKSVVGLRRPGEGQHPAQSLRRTPGPDRVRRRPEPFQARTSTYPERISRYCPPTSWPATPGLRTDHAVEPSRRRSLNSSATWPSGAASSSSPCPN